MGHRIFCIFCYDMWYTCTSRRCAVTIAVFIDSVVQRVQASGIGYYVKFICVSIILYADDILLLAPSVTALQQLLHVCEIELACLDMAINVVKSACMRIGSRHNVKCMNISTVHSHEILWCDKIKYLGIDLAAARVFRCSYDNTKRKFYRVFNAIFGEIGRIASEEVIIQLLKTKCLPVLYGLDVCLISRCRLDRWTTLSVAVSEKFSQQEISLSLNGV